MALPQYPLDGSLYFDVRELIHPDIFWAVGPDRARWYISDFQRDYVFLLREVLDIPIQINNWHTGGQRVGRGTRPRSYKPAGGGEFSQHYFKCAVDISTVLLKPVQILQKILENEAAFKAIGLTAIESLDFTRTWVHADCRPFIEGIHPVTGFLIVKP